MTAGTTRFAIFVLFGLLTLTPYGRAADKITISSTNPTAFDIDFVVARDKGFFAKENLDVEPTYMTPDLVVKALIAGTVDLARSGTHFGLIAASRGADIKIIGGSNYGYPYQVIGNPQFKTLADLKGQKIAGASLASITT
ncbi:MAG TPA: ABC transporter substrate-binding protein, partial [Candidatus Binatia bacterium]|nr:ABC transporter substrate-binding protein [Candidatus Binatia bacterium]